MAFRELTEKERKRIEKYRLPAEVEKQVMQEWRRYKNLDITVNMFVGRCLCLAVLIGIVPALWLDYLVPGLANMPGILGAGMFLLWALLVINVLALGGSLVSLEANKRYAFNKFYLELWYRQGKHIILKESLRLLYVLLLLVGLLMNGYYVSAVMVISCVYMARRFSQEVRQKVQKAIDAVDDNAAKRRL